jgi:hypothetical protein
MSCEPRLQATPQIGKNLDGHSCAHKTCVHEFAVVSVVAQEQRAEMRPGVVFDHLCEPGWPHSIVEVAREGFRRSGDMLCPLVALLSCDQRQATQLESDELPPEENDRRCTELGGYRHASAP